MTIWFYVLWYNVSAIITRTKAILKNRLSLRLKMSMESTVVTSMAQEMRNRRVMLLPCFMMADMMRPLMA